MTLPPCLIPSDGHAILQDMTRLASNHYLQQLCLSAHHQQHSHALHSTVKTDTCTRYRIALLAWSHVIQSTPEGEVAAVSTDHIFTAPVRVSVPCKA